MDENGDAEGNYTLIALDERPTRGYGLYPIAHFVGKEQGTNLPVSEPLSSAQRYFVAEKNNFQLMTINGKKLWLN